MLKGSFLLTVSKCLLSGNCEVFVCHILKSFVNSIKCNDIHRCEFVLHKLAAPFQILHSVFGGDSLTRSVTVKLCDC